jgi:hypothetical protein
MDDALYNVCSHHTMDSKKGGSALLPDPPFLKDNNLPGGKPMALECAISLPAT